MRPYKSLAIVNRLFKNSAFRLSFFLIICALFMAQFLGSSNASRGEQESLGAPVTERMLQNQSEINVRRWLIPGGGLKMPFATLVPQSGPESINTYKADCVT